MWTQTYSKVFTNVMPKHIWQLWSDINHWHLWDPDIDYAELVGSFAVGNHFILKPKGAPKVKIQLIEVEPFSKFADLTCFWGAKMIGRHEMLSDANEPGKLRLTTTLSISGPLSFIWRKLVAEGIMASEPEQMEALVARSRTLKT